jgi:uncharacterized protein (TIGR02145 family)
MAVVLIIELVAIIGALMALAAGAFDFYDTFTDERDGKKYLTVKIGQQTWMAQNINYQTESGSWCYENSPDSCGKYGRLYDWKTATTICPKGWKLPSREDWDRLVTTAGGWKTAGEKLKSKSGWNDYKGKNGNGTDDFGFSALPGGYRGTGGSFYDAGLTGYWWTATEDDSDLAYYRDIYYYNDYVNEYDDDEGDGFSVRCIADRP